ncbi:MAG TPA: hypothetical protein VNM87_08755, partial [Candidatus Udaeobacter sp.]|nr:hypothetical protein [Candidatus Udaeobacter sp.]
MPATPSIESSAIPGVRADGASSPHGTFLGIDGLEARARVLASRFALAVSSGHGARRFFHRLNDNARELRAAYRVLAEDVRRGEPVAPAAEWLLDNFHLLEAEVVGILHDLPHRYYLELPKLAAREQSGMPRIHALALDLIAHSDNRLEIDRLTRFIVTFQTVAPLTIGELWALPTMLKAALIDNIRRLADDMLADRRARMSAGGFFQRFEAETGDEESPKEPKLAHPLRLAYLVELLSRLRDQGPHAAGLRAAIESRLVAMSMSAEEAVHAQHTLEAMAHVSIGNAITSMRFCATLDWSQFFEQVSLVEQILQRDPAGVYGR